MNAPVLLLSHAAIKAPASAAPALWMLMMMLIVLPLFFSYMCTGDLLKKNFWAASILVVVAGIVLMPVSYWILRVLA